MFNINNKSSSQASGLKLFGTLLVPSWLSTVLTVTVAVILVTLTIVSAHYTGSPLQQQIAVAQAQRSQAQAASFNGLDDNPTHGRLVEDLPLVFFWALAGLIVYLLAENLVKSVIQANQLRHSLNYVNAQPGKVYKEIGERLFIRVIVLAVWLPYLLIFFHKLIPYAITAALAAGSQITVSGSIDGLVAVLIMVAAIHINIILLRLLVFKPRLFSSVVY